jgi:hypothetical protein
VSNSRFKLKEKVDKYFYWLTTYGHEAASVWVQGNVDEEEVQAFKLALKKGYERRGFK